MGAGGGALLAGSEGATDCGEASSMLAAGAEGGAEAGGGTVARGAGSDSKKDVSRGGLPCGVAFSRIEGFFFPEILESRLPD